MIKAHSVHLHGHISHQTLFQALYNNVIQSKRLKQCPTCYMPNNKDLSTSPPIAALAPISCWIFVTSLFGPAISDVPVSVIP